MHEVQTGTIVYYVLEVCIEKTVDCFDLKQTVSKNFDKVCSKYFDNLFGAMDTT